MLSRRIDQGKLMRHLGPDEAAPPMHAWLPGIWSGTFEVLPHDTMAELVRHFHLTLEARRALRRLLELQLPEKIFGRVSFALEWRN